MSDFDFEPVRGLPENLPQGETMLWQGAPEWRAIAGSVFHIRVVAAYFGAMIVWGIVSAIYDQTPLVQAAKGAAWLAALAAVCCGILAILAWSIGRTTVYTITSERLIMRIGMALPITLNIPFGKVESAAARVGGDGVGDIPLTLVADERIGYAVLWPHARPWRMRRAEPTLRCIPKAGEVGEMLGRALAAAASRPSARAPATAATVQQIRPAPGTTADAPARRRIARMA